MHLNTEQAFIETQLLCGTVSCSRAQAQRMAPAPAVTVVGVPTHARKRARDLRDPYTDFCLILPRLMRPRCWDAFPRSCALHRARSAC